MQIAIFAAKLIVTSLPVFGSSNAKHALDQAPKNMHVTVKVSDFTWCWHRTSIANREVNLCDDTIAATLSTLVQQMVDDWLKRGDQLGEFLAKPGRSTRNAISAPTHIGLTKAVIW